MNMEGIMLSEINQTDKDIWYHLYVESKKYNKLVNITEKKQSHRWRWRYKILSVNKLKDSTGNTANIL